MSAQAYGHLEDGTSHSVSLPASFFGRTPLRALSDGALVQLALCFLLSPSRADLYVVGPLVALYALREDDRRALELYGYMSAASVPIDFIFLFRGSAGFLVGLVTLGGIGLKVLLTYVAVRVHDELPAARPGRTEPAKLQAKVQEVVETVLHEVLDGTPPALIAPPPPPLPQITVAATPSKPAPANPAPAPAPARPARLPVPPPVAPASASGGGSASGAGRGLGDGGASVTGGTAGTASPTAAGISDGHGSWEQV